MSTTSPRYRLHDWLVHGRGGVGRVITTAIALLVIVSVLSLPFEFLPGFEAYQPLLRWLEIGITAIFSVEYFLRVVTSPRPLRFIFSGAGLIDLIAIAPFFIGLIDTRWVRVLQLVRLARLLKLSTLDDIHQRPDEVKSRYLTSLTLLPGETIERVAHRHPVFFLTELLLPLVLLAVGISAWEYLRQLDMHTVGIVTLTIVTVLAGLLLTKTWLDYAYNVLFITNCRLIREHRDIWGRSSHEIHLKEIKEVRTPETSILGGLFGYGSIDINLDLHLRHIAHHEHIAAHINHKKAELEEKHTSRDANRR